MTRHICLISSPRSGSNRVCEVMASVPGINGKYEMFHPENAWGITKDEIRYINKVTNSSFRERADSGEPALTNYRRSNPSEFLQHLADYNALKGYKYTFFKVFPGHLGLADFNKIIRKRDTSFAFLTRATIDAYISTIKASTTGKYTKVDTTSIKPVVNRKNFLGFQDSIIQWYCTMRQLTSAVGRVPILDYDEIYSSKNDYQKILAALKDTIGEIQHTEFSKKIVKQDQAPIWQQKISNPEVISELVDQGLIIKDVRLLLR